MAVISRFTTAEAGSDRLSEIRHLLDEAFGGFDLADWDHALGGWHVVGTEDGALVAHAAVVARVVEVSGTPFQSGYVEAVATAPARQRHGVGSRVLAEVRALIEEEFELGVLSTGRHDFYRRAGWEPWRGPTFLRHGASEVRSEEDDGGVMVLRCGPSRAIALNARISVEARAGDDW